MRCAYYYASGLLLLASELVSADVVNVSAEIGTNRIVNGLSVTNGKSAASLAIDWSLNNGLYTGADCYTSSTSRISSLSDGCQFYTGVFVPLQLSKDRRMAVEFVAHRYEFSENNARSSDYSEFSAIWHPNKNTNVRLSYTDDWLNRGFAAYSMGARFSRNLHPNFSSFLGFGLTSLENRAPVNALEFAELGARFFKEQWQAELKLVLNDSDLTRMTGFDHGEPELLLSVRYRLY